MDNFGVRFADVFGYYSALDGCLNCTFYIINGTLRYVFVTLF